ncbi:MAG: tRNA (adenosine(37)-N6)-threonylcarbamoyltransferase complex dimerization subunit type 1 TsaB [Thermaceae bacterium]
MWVLGMDTATPYLVLGLWNGQRGVEKILKVERRHEEVLFPTLRALLEEAEVEFKAIGLISVGLGPGSYTGLRMAIAAGEGLALGLGARVVGVSSLLAAAWPHLGKGPLSVAFSLRNGLYYTATYLKEGETLRVLQPEQKVKTLPPAGPLLLDPPPSGLALAQLGLERGGAVEPIYL